MGSLLLLPVGYLVSGPAARAWGQVEVMAVGGVLGCVACALGVLPRSTRTLRRLDSPVPAAAAAHLLPL
jgi:hypothetical protein